MAGVPVDPWSAGFMALGSIAKSAPVSSGASNQSTAIFDNSGWSVSIGGGTASSTKNGDPAQAVQTPAQAVRTVAAGVGGLLSSPITVIVAGLALFLFLKHK